MHHIGTCGIHTLIPYVWSTSQKSYPCKTILKITNMYIHDKTHHSIYIYICILSTALHSHLQSITAPPPPKKKHNDMTLFGSTLFPPRPVPWVRHHCWQPPRFRARKWPQGGQIVTYSSLSNEASEFTLENICQKGKDLLSSNHQFLMLILGRVLKQKQFWCL